MANKRTVALTKEEYKKCIDVLRKGFELNGVEYEPNERIATIEVLQATLGLRLGDILKLTLDSIIRDGERYRLDIKEEKTGKLRTFTVPTEIYAFIQNYAIERGIGKNKKLFPITERQVTRHLRHLFESLEMNVEKYGSHSFRKMFATQVYIENDYNIELVRILLQHSSIATTQKYISMGTKQIENVLASTSKNLI